VSPALNELGVSCPAEPPHAEQSRRSLAAQSKRVGLDTLVSPAVQLLEKREAVELLENRLFAQFGQGNLAPTDPMILRKLLSSFLFLHL
jgi:hypothetical protein